MYNRFHSPWPLFVGSFAVAMAIAGLLLWHDAPEKQRRPLVLWCAAALMEPAKEIVARYEEDWGQTVEMRVGDSQFILTQMKITREGDLFLPADDKYIERAQRDGLLDGVYPLAKMNAVLVVNPNCSKAIRSWNDLFQNDVRIALANPYGAAISEVMRDHLPPEKWRKLVDNANAVQMGPVTQVANAVKLGANIDAGFIWDNMLRIPDYRGLKAIPLPELAGIVGHVSLGVVKSGPQTAESRRLAHFFAHGERAREILSKNGFTLP